MPDGRRSPDAALQVAVYRGGLGMARPTGDDMKDPFDFSDTSDLPEDVAANLSPASGRGARYSYLVELAGRSVTCSEVRAAYCRVYGKTPTIFTVRQGLYRAARLDRVVRLSKGVYAAKEKAGGE